MDSPATVLQAFFIGWLSGAIATIIGFYLFKDKLVG
jgi:hypothetical protein